MRRRTFLIAGLIVAFLLAGVVSTVASSSPDGLDSAALRGCTTDAAGEITGGTCIAQQEQDHQLGGSPLADYGIAGVDMTSVSRELGRDVTVAQVGREVARAFGRVFDLVPVSLTADELHARIAAPATVAG